MSNILEVPQQQAIQALIAKCWSVRRIARTLTVKPYNRNSNHLLAAGRRWL